MFDKEWLNFHYKHLFKTLCVLAQNYSNRIKSFEALGNFMAEMDDAVALNYVQDRALYEHFNSMVDDLNNLSEFIEYHMDNLKDEDENEE